MPVGEIVNKSIQQLPSEHERTQKLVRGNNVPQDSITSSVPGVTSVGGEMPSQSKLHKVMVRQGPAHHYDGDGSGYGQRKL